MIELDEKKLRERAKATQRMSRWRAENKGRNAATRAAWSLANKERILATNAAWVERNKARRRATGAARYRAIANEHRAYMKKWREGNKDRLTALVADWARRNPQKRAASQARRRAAKFLATPAWANDFFIAEAYDLARRRTEMLGFPWHVDHIVPLQSRLVCGLHVEHNLRVIPAQTNQIKGSRTWPGMPQEEGVSRL